MIKFFDRFHQSQIALLNEIKKWNSAPVITFSYAHNKAGVGFNKVFSCQQPIFNYLFEKISFF